MKIIHAPIEIAGQMGILCDAQMEQGHQAIGYNYFRSYIGYDQHIIHSDLFEIGYLANQAIPYFDVFHFHYASSFLNNYNDLEMIYQQSKAAVMHHWGNDVRTYSVASRNNPYVYTADSPPPERIDERLRTISQYISTAIVQDYEVFPYVQDYYEKVHVLPLAIKLNEYEPHYPDVTNDRPLVVHAPTNPEFKGTEEIEKQVAMLKNECSFDYCRIENMHHLDARRMYKQADIVIDQVRCGSFGQLSVEAMALGKPVVVYIREDLLNEQATPPVINAHPDNLYEQLKWIIRSSECRHQYGRRGRRYVEANHDHHKIGRALLQIYQHELNKIP